MTPTTSLLKVIKAMTMIQTLPGAEDAEGSEEEGGEDTQTEEDEATRPVVGETPGAVRDLETTWTVLPAG